MEIRIFIGISLAAGVLSCAAEPSAVCLAYVGCQQAYDEATGTGPVDVTQYQPGGACWDSAENAARCTADCQTGLDLLSESATAEGLDLAACSTL